MAEKCCTCLPCTEPGNGGPTPGHCAACCGQSGIVEYDHACPVDSHREWAERQFPMALAAPVPHPAATDVGEGGAS